MKTTSASWWFLSCRLRLLWPEWKFGHFHSVVLLIVDILPDLKFIDAYC